MNILKSLLLLGCISIGMAQGHLAAPWVQDLQQKGKSTANYYELQQAFENYWQNRDKNKRASGFKPFMRNLYHWENAIDNQGNFMSVSQLWDAWREKNNQKQFRTFSTNTVPESNWEPVGPFTHTNSGSWSSGQGRVNVLYVDPNNASTVYMGTPSGGIWKSTNSGSSWTPMSDQLPQLGVSGIAVDHTDSNVIYISTGDKDAMDTYGVGVLKSTDGGITWNTTGLSFTGSGNVGGEIIMHPTNNTILWCATNAGLYKTTDAGVTWTNVLGENIKDLKLKPNDPNTVYATTGSNFYKSVDGGSNFTTISTDFSASSSRLAIAVTPADANYVYVIAANGDNSFKGIYRSTDSGATFTLRNGTTDVFDEAQQAWYNLAIAASPTNAELIFTGCLNVWKSTNGGTTMTRINSWSEPTSTKYTHADIHYLGYYGTKLYCGSDGGVYVSSNNGGSFSDKTASAQIGQFYKIAVAKETTQKMVGGLQDNGGYAFSNGQWKNYYGADGMDAAINPTNTDIYYGFIQFGSQLNISNSAGETLDIQILGPEEGNWVTPLATDSQGGLYAGYSKLYKFEGEWIQQSTTSLGASDIELVVVDPLNDNIIYVINGTKLYKSTDGGVTFTTLYTFSGSVTSFEVNGNDNTILYATTTSVSGKVFKSVNGGTSFTNISNGLPNIAKNVIKHQKGNPNNPLYLGTSLGVYYFDDTLTQWEPFDTNLPNVKVTDLDVNTVEHKLVASTYGRGIWKTSIPTGILENEVFTLKDIAIYPNPSNGVFNVSFGNLNITAIEVTDISGKTIVKHNQNLSQNASIDLTNAAPGVYFVKIATGTQQMVKKIIKK